MKTPRIKWKFEFEKLDDLFAQYCIDPNGECFEHEWPNFDKLKEILIQNKI